MHCKPKLKGSYDSVKAFIKLAVDTIDSVQVSAIDGLEGVDIAACRMWVEQSGAVFKHRSLGVVG